jgi:hypothetical protein
LVFLSLKKFCFLNFGVELEKYVIYIMMDACDAEYNAIKYHNLDTGESVFPNCEVMMCWFHVEFNVGKNLHKKNVPTSLETIVKNDIKLLHNTLSKEEYNYQLNVVWTRWSAYSSLKEFQDYFWKEWVTGRFNKWQIWNTPSPGVATTNSCIESLNKQVKFVYTGYELYSIVQFGDICFDKLVNHYSVQPKEFKYYREPTYDMIVKANEILTNGNDPIVSGGLNIYLIRSQSKPAVNYRMVVEDNQMYSGFKFVYCTCISKFNSFNQNYLIFCLIFINFNIRL